MKSSYFRLFIVVIFIKLSRAQNNVICPNTCIGVKNNQTICRNIAVGSCLLLDCDIPASGWYRLDEVYLGGSPVGFYPDDYRIIQSDAFNKLQIERLRPIDAGNNTFKSVSLETCTTTPCPDVACFFSILIYGIINTCYLTQFNETLLMFS